MKKYDVTALGELLIDFTENPSMKAARTKNRSDIAARPVKIGNRLSSSALWFLIPSRS